MPPRTATVVTVAALVLLLAGVVTLVTGSPRPAGDPAATPTTSPVPDAPSTPTAGTSPSSGPAPAPTSGPVPASPTSQRPEPPAPRARTEGPAGSARLAPYESARALASDLVAAERTIRAPAATRAEVATAALVQQFAYRELEAHPGWVDDVRARVPDRLRPAFRANLHAQVDLAALTGSRSSLPDWRIVPPPPADVLRKHYLAAAEAFGIDWTYLAAIHLVETRMGRIRGVSTAGAQGPMQFLPSTWDAYGEGEVHDPGDAIRAAARYLADHGAPDDMDGALYAYNHSDRYVRAIRAHAGVMQDDRRAYRGYHQWQVFYRLETGAVLLPEGWSAG